MSRTDQGILISIVIWGIIIIVLWSYDCFTSDSNAALPAPVQYVKFDEVRFAKCLEWAEQTILSRRDCVTVRVNSNNRHIYTENTMAAVVVSMAIMRYEIEIGMP